MAIGIFLCAMDQTIVVSSYASIGSELNQLQNTSWIATAYMMTLTSFHDIFGRKACLLFAYTVFALGCLSCGFAQTLPQLILARGLAGIGGGGMSTVVSIIMSDIVPLRSRGTWQGIMNIIYASGQRRKLRLQTKLKRVDFSGALSLVLCVFFLLFGLDRGGNISWNDKYTISACRFRRLFRSVCVRRARLGRRTFAPRRIIAHRSLIGAYMVNLFALMSSFSMIFHVSLFYQAVGFWLMPTVFGGVIGSLGGDCTSRHWAVLLVTFYAYLAMAVSMLGTVLQAGLLPLPLLGSVVGLSVGSTLLQLSLRTSLRRALSDDVDVDEIIRRVRASLTYIDELDAVTAGIVRARTNTRCR
ncbi:member of the major facilitator superfamily [Mycena leptocephala]|nr:member of the major facilitator superfamily [Mycena leptocephala]